MEQRHCEKCQKETTWTWALLMPGTRSPFGDCVYRCSECSTLVYEDTGEIVPT